MLEKANPMDMSLLPAQLARDPKDAAARRARYFNSGNAFNIKLAPVPSHVFAREAEAALAPDAPTGLIECDQSGAMQCPFAATTPLMLARYATIQAGATLETSFEATGAIFYVIRGEGETRQADGALGWAKGDVFLMPGGAPMRHSATTNAVLWVVTNEPQFAYDKARAADLTSSEVEPVHYPASDIEAQIDLLYQYTPGKSQSGIAVIFSSDRQEERRNIMPTLTLSLNTLAPKSHQPAHRHNSAAITLVLDGEACHSMVGGMKAQWRPWATVVTPPGAPHSHHNDGGRLAKFLIVQDGGLHYHARTMGFEFLET